MVCITKLGINENILSFTYDRNSCVCFCFSFVVFNNLKHHPAQCYLPWLSRWQGEREICTRFQWGNCNSKMSMEILIIMQQYAAVLTTINWWVSSADTGSANRKTRECAQCGPIRYSWIVLELFLQVRSLCVCSNRIYEFLFSIFYFDFTSLGDNACVSITGWNPYVDYGFIYFNFIFLCHRCWRSGNKNPRIVNEMNANFALLTLLFPFFASFSSSARIRIKAVCFCIHFYKNNNSCDSSTECCTNTIALIVKGVEINSYTQIM